MDDIMFGEEDAKYIKPKKKRKIKKSKHKHNYIWSIGDTTTDNIPQILVRHCTECGKVDNVMFPFFKTTIKTFPEYKEAVKNPKIFILSPKDAGISYFILDFKFV